MIFFRKKSQKKEAAAQAWRLRWMGETAENRKWLTTSQILYGLGFLLFTSIIVFICFVGQSAVNLQVLPGQIAKTRILAQFPFSYESKVQRKQLIEERCQKIAPCYSLTLEPYNVFRKKMLAFSQGLNDWDKANPGQPSTERLHSLEAFIQSFNSQNQTTIQIEDAQILLTLGSEVRFQAFEEALLYLKDIVGAGILDSHSLSSDSTRPFFFSIHIEGQQGTTTVQSPEEALLAFRRYLRILEVDTAASNAFFRMLKPGVQPNLVYDAAQSTHQMHHIASTIAPVVVHIDAGSVLLDPGNLVSQEQYERLVAYKNELRQREDTLYGFSASLLENLLLTFVLLIASVVHIRLSLPRLHASSRKMALCALVLIFNLALIRGLFLLGDFVFFNDTFGLGPLLPYLAPVAIGPILVAIILEGGPAVLLGLLTAALTTLMQGRGLDVCILYLVSTFVGVAMASRAKLRGRVVRAGALAGLTTAIGAAALGLDDVPIHILLQQSAMAMAIGILTGIIVLGLLPLLEHLFKLTTDITLLELTDFNHPLLRRLQLIAPGTYHHSLMVANLAERAAASIGANPLTCRAAALFHDIGKMVKPEYFIENQQEGFNPHQSRSPSMSALVIKHHVKEGVEIAREAKLPKLIIDMIEQHHGTTLIQYFYSKAVQQLKTTDSINHGATGEGTVDETTYRYDGPKPAFRESAILFFSDTIEAASRTLKKVTPQHIDDLVDRIFDDRLTDHQLDNCPLTFKELSELKKSFSFTLLNMFHARVEYPGKS